MFRNDDFSLVAAAIPVFVNNNLEGISKYIPGDILGRIFQNMNGKDYEPDGCRYVLAHQKDVMKEVMVALKANRFEMNEATAIDLVAAFIPVMATQMKALSEVLTDDEIKKIPLKGKQSIKDKSQQDLNSMRSLILGGLGFALSQRLLLNDPDACIVDGAVYEPARNLVTLIGQIATNYVDLIIQYDATKDNSRAIAANCIEILQALDVKDANNNAALKVLKKCGIRNSAELEVAKEFEEVKEGRKKGIDASTWVKPATIGGNVAEHWQEPIKRVKPTGGSDPTEMTSKSKQAAQAGAAVPKAPKTGPLSRLFSRKPAAADKKPDSDPPSPHLPRPGGGGKDE